MLKRSLFLKIFGGFGLMILLMSVLTTFISFGIIRSHYHRRLATELEHVGRAMTLDILRLMEGPPEALESFLVDEGRKIESRVTVIAPGGAVLGDSERNPAEMESHRYRPEVAEALEGKTSRADRFSYTVEDRMIYVAIPLKDDSGGVRAVLRLSVYARGVDALLADLRGGIIRAVLIVTALALLAALFFTLSLTRPLQALVRASEKVAEGDFGAKVRVGGGGEFRHLAGVFNAMTDRLEAQFEDLERRKEELANIIASIREGLAVIGRDGRILFSNEAFHSLFPKAAGGNRGYLETVRSAGLQSLIEDSRREKAGRTVDVKIGDRSFLAAAGYLPAQDGIVLLLTDMTERRRVDEMKKDFIVNASHELRTPLAAISGALELLLDGKAINDPAALDILSRHVVRMRAIVDDLLKLGELESPETRLDLKAVDPAALARRVVELYADRAAEKGLFLKIEAAPDLPPVRADEVLLEQLLINLVDNAVKYTDRGGVTISLSPGKGQMTFQVSDTGPGIAAEHLPRIFERFYLVDPARSRKLGGTGLGLSIAKHIVLLHGGAIEARSEAGAGTAFSVRLPLA
ncbi:MAG: ATP-binding protein [Acidobacteriota bacterium]|nr:ATP-binding protein [Acidobacteriota bacterium]HOF82160.1 ATP-binding protein [Candidatus Aminicenantes bacterium]MDD8029793.1 ATP-binding protein [Acidobacteriota bacterium]MDD8033818.1 ATP-binding protein [Acidobacteriota bacterium]MDD8038827.1 ATP-binding protein [Acidobacteriota bacterium]